MNSSEDSKKSNNDYRERRIMMKSIAIVAMMVCSLSMSAQTVNFKAMRPEKRNEYMIKLAKEIIMNFGPGYYREVEEPKVLEEIKTFDVPEGCDEEQMRCNGRKYYEVQMVYDKNKERLAWGYAAKVRIWADDGEPFYVTFGNGMGVNFIYRSYRELLKEGIEDDMVIKYQPVKRKD